MRIVYFAKPEKLKKFMSQGKKIAIFEIDNDEKPINLISEVFYEERPNPNSQLETIKPAIKYINEHLKNNISLNALAKLCGISQSHFSALFIECMKVSPIDFLIKKRLDYACKLLKETSMSVVSISMSIGYTDSSYFNRLFKKKIGLTPLQFREAHKNDLVF